MNQNNDYKSNHDYTNNNRGGDINPFNTCNGDYSKAVAAKMFHWRIASFEIVI